jgi:streptogramin lyase
VNARRIGSSIRREGTIVRLAIVAFLALALCASAPGSRAAATDRFTFVSAFAIDPPDANRWEPPPGGVLPDGVYTWRRAPEGMRVALTIGPSFSPFLVDPAAWSDEEALRGYHRLLLEEEARAATRGLAGSRRLARSSVALDERFGPPAIAREVVVEDLSPATGEVTGLLTTLSWRFRHPDSPIVEFVAEVRFRSRPGEPAPGIAAEDLSFLATLAATPLDAVVDRAIALEGDAADAIALGHGSLWVSDRSRNTLSRIDPVSGAAVASVSIGAGPHAVLATEDAVWVANHNDDTVQRIDPERNVVTATAAVPQGPHQLLSHGSQLWLACDAGCIVTRIDAGTGGTIGEPLRLGVAGRSRSGRREKLWRDLGRDPGECSDLSISMASAGADLLVAERFLGTIARLSPDGSVRRVDVGAELGPLLVEGADLWGIDDLARDGIVYRIDASTGRIVARIKAGRVSSAPVAAGGVVWIAREREDTLVRVDPATNRLVGRPLPVDSPSAIVSDATGLWVAGGRSVVHVPIASAGAPASEPGSPPPQQAPEGRP